MVSRRNARRDELARRGVFDLRGSDRPDRDAILLNEERILLRAVHAAAIFDNADPAGRHLIDHAMIERDDAIGEVFLQAIASQRAVAAFAGHDDRDAFCLSQRKSRRSSVRATA